MYPIHEIIYYEVGEIDGDLSICLLMLRSPFSGRKKRVNRQCNIDRKKNPAVILKKPLKAHQELSQWLGA